MRSYQNHGCVNDSTHMSFKFLRTPSAKTKTKMECYWIKNHKWNVSIIWLNWVHDSRWIFMNFPTCSRCTFHHPFNLILRNGLFTQTAPNFSICKKRDLPNCHEHRSMAWIMLKHTGQRESRHPQNRIFGGWTPIFWDEYIGIHDIAW